MNTFHRTNDKEQIAKLELDIFASRKLDLGASHMGNYRSAGGFKV